MILLLWAATFLVLTTRVDFQMLLNLISGALTKSQFPVFTIYAQKTCLGVRPCARAWCIDRVQNYRLDGHAKRVVSVTSRRDCLELCLGETEFICRWAIDVFSDMIERMFSVDSEEIQNFTNIWASTKINVNLIPIAFDIIYGLQTKPSGSSWKSSKIVWNQKWQMALIGIKLKFELNIK